jgi:hypothetical protein
LLQSVTSLGIKEIVVVDLLIDYSVTVNSS